MFWSLRPMGARLAAAVLFGVSSAALAQNLVPNPTFATSVSPWPSPALFNPLDANGSPNSGSLQLALPASASSSGRSAGICLPVPPEAGATYRIGGKIQILPGGVAGAFGAVQFAPFSLGSCSGSLSGGASISSLTVGTFALVQATVTVPAATGGGAVFVQAIAPAGNRETIVLFDDLFVIKAIPATITVPTSASIHGANNTFFQTDLWVMNRSFTQNQPVTARFRCFTGQSCPGDVKSFQLAPRETARFTDVVGTLFGAPETAGAIELTYDTTLGSISATSRTYTPSLPAPTNGTAIPAFTGSEARTRALYLGLGNNGGDLSSGFRSNAGAYNPNGVPVAVTFTLTGASGVRLGTPFTRTYAPNEAFQIGNVFAAVGANEVATTAASLVVTAPQPVFPFVTVIDNQSGDSVFAAASTDEAAP